MEEFGWIILFFLFWVFSTVGDFRKQQRKKRRRDEDVGTGPAAGERDLATDIAEGARRAEEALRRWEARQREEKEVDAGPATEEVPRRQLPDRREFEIAGASMSRERQRASRELRAKRREAVELERRAETARREAEEERKDAYEAITGMLAGREVGSEAEIGSGAEIGAGPKAGQRGDRTTGRRRARATEAASGMPLARSAPMGESGVGSSAAAPSAGAVGLGRLDRLPPLQRAVVLRELLGPPKALSPGTDLC